MNDVFFLTSPSSTSVDIKKIALPELKSSFWNEFYDYKEAKLSYRLSANIFLPQTSPEVKSNLSFGGGGAIEAKLRNQSFKIGFEVNMLKAAGNSTNSKNIYWNYIWENL
jgi:hypothetical protein